MLSVSRLILKSISLGRLVVALVLATLVWGYVIATQYPEKTTSFANVPVLVADLPNASSLLPRQYSTQTVKVTINGAKDKMDSVQLSAIQPIINLTACIKPGTCEVKVALKQQPESVNYYSIEPDTIQVQLEEVVTRDFSVQVNRVGVVKPDYQQGEIKLSTSVVRVSGPKSVVDRVDKAQITVDLTDRDTNLQGSVDVVLLDEKGQEISDKNLKSTPTKIDLTTPVTFKLNAKTVPIKVITTGSPAPGYIAGSSVTNEPTVVTLNGDPRILEPIKYVETSQVDLSNATSDIFATAKLRVPDNTAVIGSLEVAVRIGITVAQASVPVEIKVEIVNPPPNNLRYELKPTTVEITLQGPYQLLQPKLPLDQIKATVDLAGLNREGTYKLPLKVETPVGLVATNLPEVTVILVAAPRPTPVPLPQATPTPTQVVPPTSSPAASPTSAATAQPTQLPLVPPPASPTGVGLASSPTRTAPSEPSNSPAPTSTPPATGRTLPIGSPTSVVPNPTPLPSPKNNRSEGELAARFPEQFSDLEFSLQSY